MNPSMSSAKAVLSQVRDKTTEAKLDHLGAYSINHIYFKTVSIRNAPSYYLKPIKVILPNNHTQTILM